MCVCVFMPHARFSYVPEWFWWEITLFSSKSLVLMFTYIDIKVMQFLFYTWFLVLSLCDISLNNVVSCDSAPSWSSPSLPTILLALPLWWRASVCNDEVMSITEQTNRNVCLRQTHTRTCVRARTHTYDHLCSVCKERCLSYQSSAH